MNASTHILPDYWQWSASHHRQGMVRLIGIVILATVCQTSMGQEMIPIPSGSPSQDSQGQAFEEEGWPQACQPMPEDPDSTELTVDIQPRDEDSQIVPEENLPVDCAQYVFSDVPILDELSLASGGHRPGYNWAAARFSHHPLYFQECCLERCGVDHGCYQPFLSGAGFFGGIVLLPYKMWQSGPCSCVRTPAYDCAR